MIPVCFVATCFIEPYGPLHKHLFSHFSSGCCILWLFVGGPPSPYFIILLWSAKRISSFHREWKIGRHWLRRASNTLSPPFSLLFFSLGPSVLFPPPFATWSAPRVPQREDGFKIKKIAFWMIPFQVSYSKILFSIWGAVFECFGLPFLVTEVLQRLCECGMYLIKMACLDVLICWRKFDEKRRSFTCSDEASICSGRYSKILNVSKVNCWLLDSRIALAYLYFWFLSIH